jgi:myosin heavy subunit
MVEPAKWYNYLNQSTCIAIEGVDDVKMFDDLRRAMAVLDMPNEMQV